jgi:hypothetical protein
VWAEKTLLPQKVCGICSAKSERKFKCKKSNVLQKVNQNLNAKK